MLLPGGSALAIDQPVGALWDDWADWDGEPPLCFCRPRREAGIFSRVEVAYVDVFDVGGCVGALCSCRRLCVFRDCRCVRCRGFLR